MAVAFRSAGTAASGTGAVTPGLPSGHAADDILILVQQMGAADTPTTPTGYALITNQDATSLKVYVYWKRDNGSESAPSVADPGNHQICQIYAFSGCITAVTPHADATQWSRTASTSALYSASGVGYSQNNSLVVLVAAHGNDSATGDQFSSWLNPSSVFDSALTEASGSDLSTSLGTGGGFALAYAAMTTAGTVAANTQFATIANSLGIACVSFVLKPPAVTLPEFVQQPLQPRGGYCRL